MNPIASLIGQLSIYGALVFVVAATVFAFAWQYYEAVLKEKGRDCDKLLDRLAKGGGPRAFYMSQMTALLDHVDGLLGDAGLGQSWVARLFRLRKAQPCWTARSLDTCAVLAVLYPFASLLATWLLVGDAGPIGDLLGLSAQPERWVRPAVAAAAALLVFSPILYYRSGQLFWATAFSVAVTFSFSLSFAGAGSAGSALAEAGALAAAVVGALAFRAARSTSRPGVVAVSLAFVFSVAVVGGGANALLGVVAFVVVGAAGGSVLLVDFDRARGRALLIEFDLVNYVLERILIVSIVAGIVITATNSALFATLCLAVAVALTVAVVNDFATETGRFGAFWATFWSVALGAGYLSLWFGGLIGSKSSALGLVLMIVLLPLVNLPFDWASIGMTRALLRRGCEDHGIWLSRSPTLLCLIDFLLGLALLAALAAALVLTFSAADAILSHAGRKTTFDAVRLIEQIKGHPGDPAYGWVYFTLLSTLLPSFFNLLVGVFSLLTFSVPPVRRWMIATIPILDGPGLGGTRWQVVFALSAQWFCGVLLTGIGLWLVWLGILQVPGIEAAALDPLQDFAHWCARLFGLAELEAPPLRR